MQNGKTGFDRRNFLKMALMGAAGTLISPLLSTDSFASVGSTVSINDIKTAAKRIKGHVQRTPLVQSGLLSKEVGVDLYLKLENMQYTGAFKERGALNKLSTLTPAERKRGVIAASAGNHSQGVAYHATRLGIPSFIAMPRTTPNTKVSHTRALGAEVLLVGDSFDEALKFALNKAKEDGLTFVHPFDDPLVISGQGTVGLEIMEDMPDIDILLVPIGGGGLISGCATAAKAINPKLKIYGVEPRKYSAMKQRLHDEPVSTGGETLAEGLAVHNVGELPFTIVERLVDDVLLVKEESISKAINHLFEQRKIVAEGAGAAGTAAIIEHNSLFEGKKVATPITGGNIDSRLFANLLNQSLAENGKLVQMRVLSPGRGDIYPEIAAILNDSEASVVNLQFDPIFHAFSAKSPAYILTLETKDKNHAGSIVKNLQKNGLDATLIK